MRKSFFFIVIFLTLVNLKSQQLIINEIYNSSGNDEWVELLVVGDNLDIRNWSLRDFNTSGVAQNPLNFSNHSLWSNLKKGTIIVVARPENTFSEDLDDSDYLLVVKTSNTLYFSGNPFSIAGSSEAVQIRNASQAHEFGVSWGSANANSLTAPKVHFSGSSSSNTSIYFNEDNVSKLTNTANWTMNGTSSRGVGNTPTNIAWILSLRARAEGSGLVGMNPLVTSGDSTFNLKFTYFRDTQYSINALKIVVPNNYDWAQSASAIVYNNFNSSLNVNGNTILFSNIIFNSDSVEIFINNITSPHFTGKYKFTFQSGIDNTLADVSPQPVMTVYGAGIPIAEAKQNDANGVALLLGNLVTIRGIVTVSNQFGSPSYVQDNSGGISIFGSIFSNAVQIGDEVTVSGTVAQFNGLNQLENPILHSINSSGNTVEPIIATPTELSGDGIGGLENYEGRLVRVNAVLVTELNGTPVSNWAYKNYKLTGSSAADTVQIRIDNDTEIIGTVAPAGRFDVIGVLSQFKSTLPLIGGYQLMPRKLSDIISSGPIIEKFPEEVNLTSNSITLEWHTLNPGTSRIRYGTTTNYELGVVEPDNVLRTVHNVSVTGLNAATVYHLQAFSVASGDTSFSSNIISSTSSPSQTTGQINAYFNKNVYTGVSSGVNAAGNYDFKTHVIQRINNAKRSIDAALYSLSGTVGSDVAQALVAARNRGVKVRVVGEYDTRTTAPWTYLSNNAIPYINDQFGNNDGSGLHHNKFFIIDYRGGAPDSVWLITGSWNPTDPGTNDDRQNLIEFQDVAIAGAYTLEFEEMWGSNTETPNAVNSRFGSRKLNNTPHNFNINGTWVEVYFSPSDRTTYNIGRTLSKTASSINGAIMTFTRRDLADTVIAVKSRNRKVRLILSNNTDSGSQFSFLQSNGIDIRLKGFSTGLLHHKYAVVDAEPLGYSPYVITGSHNWSSAAENSNDENTVIIQNDLIANFYLQEFAARYYEANGTDSINIISSVDDLELMLNEYNLYQNYPNPFNPSTTIAYSIPEYSKVSLIIYNTLGQKVAELVNDYQYPGKYKVDFSADSKGLSSGVYFYSLKAGEYYAVKKFLLLK